jgi:hypothetical protein
VSFAIPSLHQVSVSCLLSVQNAVYRLWFRRFFFVGEASINPLFLDGLKSDPQLPPFPYFVNHKTVAYILAMGPV